MPVRRPCSNTHLQYGAPAEHGGAHEHHAVARHGGGGGVLDVVRLEHHLAVGRHGDAVAVGQRQRLVVVQHRVEVLDPDSVHGPVQHEPDVFPWGGTDGVT